MKKQNSQRPTIHDVAARAQVSAQTVSRVVNNSELVTEETRTRVLHAIEELDYQPNHAARSLNKQRSNVILVINFRTDYPYAAWDMLARAKELGYQVMFITVDPFSAKDIRTAFASALKYLCEGIILASPFIELAISQTEIIKLCRNIPAVFLDTPLGSPLPSVIINQRYGSQIATQHLIDLGHRQIVEVSGPVEELVDARERHESWQETMARNGLSADCSIEAGAGGFSFEGGYQAIHELLNSGYAFTALLAGNDDIAIGALRALRERGLRVPEDISLVGFDDASVSAYLLPQLTTIRQDFVSHARRTVEYLVSMIKGIERTPKQVVLKPELIIRQSTQALTRVAST